MAKVLRFVEPLPVAGLSSKWTIGTDRNSPLQRRRPRKGASRLTFRT
jgi:hypothetical protein